jgi:hypothetical protein
VLSGKFGAPLAPLVANGLDVWWASGAAVVVPTCDRVCVVGRNRVMFFNWTHIKHMASMGVTY